MDFQEKIAARRAELKENTRETQRLVAEQAKAQREQALDQIASEVSRDGLAVHRQGDKLAAVTVENAMLEFDGLKQPAIDKLLAQEARKMWTPSENWQIITLIVAGVFLITSHGLGLILILFGFLGRNGLNRRYKSELRQRYPAVFSGANPQPSATEIQEITPTS